MSHDLSELKPRPNDLVVVPEGMEVPSDVPFLVYPMKFLWKPSIIRSGAYDMGVLERITSNSIAEWLGLSPAKMLKPNPYELTDLPPSIKKEVEHAKQRQVLPRFFRYHRPLELNAQKDGEDGFKMVPAPRGGVAFLIELDAENRTFAFSYALCHNNDNFNFGIARKICSQRFASEDWYEVKNYDPEIGIMENISWALYNLLYNDKADDEADIVFSSLSDRMTECDMKQIYERLTKQ